MKTVILILPLAAAAALSSQSAPKVFGENHDGKEITVKVGESFIVKLPTNPTTGYSLFLLSDGNEPWSLASRSYKTSPAPAGTVGVGGFETFTFKATRSGSTQLAIISARGFDLKNTLKQAKPFVLRVSVK